MEEKQNNTNLFYHNFTLSFVGFSHVNNAEE